MQVAGEKDMTAALFALDDEPNSSMMSTKAIILNGEKDYKEFGKQTGEHLYKGPSPYHVEKFFRELCKGMSDHCDSKQIKKVVDHIQIILNEKTKKEKEERDGKNKKKKAPTLAGGGAKGYEFNNNPGMVADVMGGNGNEDDDYGDYGEEGFTKEGEADYDFM